MDDVKQWLMPANHWDWSIPVPFSQSWRCGDLIFVGGQISADAHGRTVGVGDIEAQTRNVFEGIRSVLAEAGATMADVVKINTSTSTRAKATRFASIGSR